ncbi:MAG: hypothetical protein J6B16_05200 [Clostridia bacterium]|nr:hypothetical protein [Clostridia bacterium]
MKKLCSLILACCFFVTLFATGCQPDPEVITLRPEIELIEGTGYSNEIGVYDNTVKTESTEVYNKSLFYRNGLLPYTADPGVFYCNDETDTENFGTYFCFGTNGNNSYSCMYSDDCVSWKWKYGSYVWPDDGWEGAYPFAPEIIWDKDAIPTDYGIDDDGIGTGTYFMFYTAGPSLTYNYETSRAGGHTTIGLAVSASPYGPYTMWNGVELGATIDGVNYAEAENFKLYTDYAEQDLSEVTYHGRRDGQVTNDDQWFNFAAARASLTFQWENKDSAGEVVNGTLVNEAAKYMLTDEGYLSFGCLDAHPFVDPVTKDKYFYVAHRSSVYITDDNDENLFPGFSSYVIKTLDNDWAQLDYSTITRVTRPYYNFVSAEAAIAYNEDAGNFNASSFKDGFKETVTHQVQKVQIDIIGNDIAMNEGPFVYYNKDTGLYYLTVSSGSYPQNTYCVIQLVGYSPMGPFRKLDADEGGMVLSVQLGGVNDLITGVGHHSFAPAGDDLLIIYHRHQDLKTNIHIRHPATDRIVWVKNDLGMTVMRANGPTSNLQPLFYGNGSTEYDIISGDATASAVAMVNGQKAYNDAKYINDGVIATMDDRLESHIKEFESTALEVTITLKFDSYRDITAIMVYNSRDFYKAFLDVKRIEMDFIKDGIEGTAYINNLKFDWDMNLQEVGDAMRAGGSAIAVFNELKVNEIRITIENPNMIEGYAGIVAVSEVYVLGKPINA